MTEPTIQLHDKVLSNLAAMGEAGASWLNDLPKQVRRLESAWGVRVGRTFPNATEAYVAEAVAADGIEVTLKIPIVGPAKADREARVLEAAQGRGYVRLLRHDVSSGAMLLERLGSQLAQQGRPVDEQLRIICSTLERAWMQAPSGLQLPTGAEKANEMASYIASIWQKLGKPCSEKTIEVALRLAKARADAFDPATAVVSHGDAHAWNTLHDPRRAITSWSIPTAGLLSARTISAFRCAKAAPNFSLETRLHWAEAVVLCYRV